MFRSTSLSPRSIQPLNTHCEHEQERYSVWYPVVSARTSLTILTCFVGLGCVYTHTPMGNYLTPTHKQITPSKLSLGYLRAGRAHT